MATVKISQLPALTGANTAATDVIPIVDVSGNVTNKITREEFFKNIASVDINGGTIDGTVIGGTSAAAGTFTTVTASGDLTIADKIVHSGDTNTAIRFPAADTVTVETSGAERLRVDSSGNVGIGTASGTNRLELGVISFAANQTANGIAIKDTSDVFKAKWTLETDSGGVPTVRHTSPTGDYITVQAGGVAQHIAFGVGNTERLRIDASGNLGLGITPSAWGTSGTVLKAMQIGTAASFSGGSGFNDAFIASNSYYDGSNWRYINSNPAYHASVGGTAAARWFTAPSGTAGNPITFTQAMTLDASGNLGIGTSSPSVKLHVASSGNVEQYLASGTNSSTARLYFINNTANSSIGCTSAGNEIAFYTGATERARIDSSGNVGIGTTTGIDAPLTFAGSVGKKISLYSGSDYSIGIESSELRFVTSGFMSFYRSGYSGSESMRIDSSGNLLVGTTARRIDEKMVVVFNGGSGSGLNLDDALVSGTATAQRFYRNGAQVGTISTTASATAYNTSSDYRLKENVAPMQNALDTVAQLNPVTYTWKADGSAGQGFIAHELQAVVPDCVTGEKDAVDETGNPQYQGVDTSFLVATLVKAIQELTARVAELENR